MSEEIKVTKEKLRRMAEECAQVDQALRRGFPEAFEKKWENITENMEWITKKGINGCFLIGLYGRKEVVQLESGRRLCLRYTDGASEEKYRIEETGDRFRILKKK